MTRYEIQLAAEDPGASSAELAAPLDEAALGAIRRAALREPTDPDYHFILGTALAREGRLELARAAFREACAGSPKAALRRQGLEVKVPGDAVSLTSGERWRVVECHYSVTVDLLPGLPVPLNFRIRVDEPFLAEPDPVFL
jgi:hypothetical protein